MNKQFYGVWANENIELVITERIILLFLVDGKEQISVLKTYELNEDRMNIFTKSVAYFNKSNKKASCKYYLKSEDKWNEWGNQNDFSQPRFKESFLLRETGTSIEIVNKQTTFLKFNKVTKNLTIDSHLTKRQKLKQIEKIEIANFKIGTKATKVTVGECLVKWCLGTTYDENDVDQTFALEIFTNKHSYIYSFMKWEGMQILYCRAARIKTNNNGSVFAQNVRMMKNDNEFSANFPPNNFEISNQDIKINNDLFNPKSCVFIDGGNEIYWSLKNISDNLIILNGCGGEEYKYSRPIKENEDNEYFK